MTESSNVTPLRQKLQAAEPPKRGEILPDDCPVKALGVQGDFYFYLDAKAQLRQIKFDKHSRSAIVSLFQGNVDYILSKRAWQRRDDDGNIKGIRPEAIADDLMRAAAGEGIFSPDGRLRGRGAWCGADNDLVLHLGDALWIKGKIAPCGVRGESIYAVLPPRPYPAREPQPGGPGGPAFALHGLLQKWRWKRPGTDDLLLLGWICAAKLGGALAWRPSAWLTGGRGCGKSTLQGLLRDLFVSRQGIISVTNPTEAGLRQALRHDAIPVALDEFESKADNTRAQAVLDLARDASSGGEILRGGTDHAVQSFTVRSSLLFSSINAPPMPPANRSRIAFLHLEKLPRGSKPPPIKPDALRALGQQLLRRLADQWPHFAGRLETWREALQARGYDARQQDQFGTLLAAADLALHDDAPGSDALDEVADALVNGSAEERADEIEDWAACLQHLTSAVSPSWRGGEQRTVGTLVAIAAGEEIIEVYDSQRDTIEIRAASADEQIAAGNMLATVGLRVLPRPDDSGPRMLAIANMHTGLNHLFTGSHWQAGSGDQGVWRQALLHCPGARASTGTVKFRGVTQRAVLVPLAIALGQPAPDPSPEPSPSE